MQVLSINTVHRIDIRWKSVSQDGSWVSRMKGNGMEEWLYPSVAAPTSGCDLCRDIALWSRYVAKCVVTLPAFSARTARYTVDCVVESSNEDFRFRFIPIWDIFLDRDGQSKLSYAWEMDIYQRTSLFSPDRVEERVDVVKCGGCVVGLIPTEPNILIQTGIAPLWNGVGQDPFYSLRGAH